MGTLKELYDILKKAKEENDTEIIFILSLDEEKKGLMISDFVNSDSKIEKQISIGGTFLNLVDGSISEKERLLINAIKFNIENELEGDLNSESKNKYDFSIDKIRSGIVKK